MGIRQNADRLLDLLQPTEQERGLSGATVSEKLGLSAEDVNDAVSYLRDQGLANVRQTLGTVPYDFNNVWLTLDGRMKSNGAEIKAAAATMLSTLAGKRGIGGPDLVAQTGLSVRMINYASELLERGGLAEMHRALGSGDFDFTSASITTRGKLWLEDHPQG